MISLFRNLICVPQVLKQIFFVFWFSNMRAVYLYLSLLLCSVPVFAFDFKGISVGSPATPEQVLDKLGVKCGLGFAKIQVCNGQVTIAQEIAEMNLVISVEGIVQRIDLTLSPRAFPIVAPLLIEKFGVPVKTDQSDVQNGMGVKFEQTVHWWRNEMGLEVQYRKYAGSVDRSVLYFSTKEDRQARTEREAKRRSDI